MVDAQTFLTDFCKDLVASPLDRQKIIAGYASHLRSRDTANHKAGIRRVLSIKPDTIITEQGAEVRDILHVEHVKQLLEDS